MEFRTRLVESLVRQKLDDLVQASAAEAMEHTMGENTRKFPPDMQLLRSYQLAKSDLAGSCVNGVMRHTVVWAVVKPPKIVSRWHTTLSKSEKCVQKYTLQQKHASRERAYMKRKID